MTNNFMNCLFALIPMYPTGWGWITISLLALNVLPFVWKRLRKPGSVGHGKLLHAGSVVLLLLFLFAFVQWAEWYK